ncbi:S24/S26 family peptidase [Parabacteroides sp. OttesenSCG-928-G07]|nr:S24/S26 family peptidase [Parabacteroides sp. OttesenSCG-928-G21]MDL2278082.1 S24/S26 family peptidase [Parabacteroides sp. OttesenSCG-928-G07]
MLLINNVILGQQVKETLLNGHSAIIPVKGSSMYPFLRNNRDLVTLKSPRPEDLRPGRIVFFQQGEKYILHRIIRKTNDLFLIRGDNRRDTSYEYVPEKNIIGYVSIIHRDGKKISCDNYLWRIISKVWIIATPIRLWLYPIMKHFRERRQT